MPIHYRPTVAEIDLNALRSNALLVREKIPANCKILAIVKANAYGHGAVQCARALKGSKIEALGVATLEEGIELRNAGIKGDIVILDGILSENVTDFFEFGFKPVLHQMEDLTLFGDLSKSFGKSIGVHLKFDTGMGRLGFLPEEVHTVLDALRRYSDVKVEGVMTHLARADEEDATPTEIQFDKFKALHAAFNERGINAAFHIANSAAILDGRFSETGWVRPGIMLYGAHPHPRQESAAALKPVMAFKTKILSIRRQGAGVPLSYGGTFTTRQESLIGVLPVGYADGYPRSLSNRASVLVNGQRAPVVGRVCMDLTLIDLSSIPDAKKGDEVVLIGSQKGERIKAEEVAQWAETISYEVLCGISARVPRVYINS